MANAIRAYGETRYKENVNLNKDLLKFSKYLFLSKAGAKKKGRPARDSCYLLRILLIELIGAKAGCQKFFGQAWQVLRRTVFESESMV